MPQQLVGKRITLNPYFTLSGGNIIHDNKVTTGPALQITIFITCISPARIRDGHALPG